MVLKTKELQALFLWNGLWYDTEKRKKERKRGRENNSSLFEELLYMDGISKKIYLELPLPTEEENRSDQKRILDGLKQLGTEAYMPLKILRKLYPFFGIYQKKMTFIFG